MSSWRRSPTRSAASCPGTRGRTHSPRPLCRQSRCRSGRRARATTGRRSLRRWRMPRWRRRSGIRTGTRGGSGGWPTPRPDGDRSDVWEFDSWMFRCMCERVVCVKEIISFQNWMDILLFWSSFANSVLKTAAGLSTNIKNQSRLLGLV